MRRRLVYHLLFLFFTLGPPARSTVLAVSIGRVTLGETVKDVCTVASQMTKSNDYSDFRSSFGIQEDMWSPGNVLMAIGNAVYTIDKNGYATILAGSDDSGNANGKATSARFSKVAGLFQLNNSVLLISDRHNQCIRQLNRASGSIMTYAGYCTSHTHQFPASRYEPWETFNSPGKVTSGGSETLYALDVIDGKSVIIFKNLITSEAKIIQKVGSLVNDFLYDPLTSSFIVSGFSGVINISSSGEVKKLDTISPTESFGLINSQGILAVADHFKGAIMAVDLQLESKYLFTLCRYSGNWELPTCEASRASAVAIIGGYLYFSNVETTFRGDDMVVLTTIKRLQFSVLSFEEYEKLTTTPTTPTTTTTEFRLPTWNPAGYDANSYDPDDTSSLDVTMTSLIVVGCLAAAALKVTLIGWCIYRRYRRRHLLRTSTTIVSLPPAGTTSAVVTHQSNLAYGRLQESYSPSTDGLPAYTPTKVTGTT